MPGIACTIGAFHQYLRGSGPPRGAAIAIVTPKEPTDLDTLAAYAEGYAEFAMKNIGRVPSTRCLSPARLTHASTSNAL